MCVDRSRSCGMASRSVPRRVVKKACKLGASAVMADTPFAPRSALAREGQELGHCRQVPVIPMSE